MPTGEKIKFTKFPDEKLFLKSKEMDLDAGFLGRFFGSKTNAPLNIAGTLVVLLIISGIAILFFKTLIQPLEYWKTILPLITLVMGFVFGKDSGG